ncbi:MAG: T9SS type A sorting domain-containing protein [Bacteroidia bacterium]|nr:T9SS type A sorting domain-containing protein [Bacteroidia bacterium]
MKNIIYSLLLLSISLDLSAQCISTAQFGAMTVNGPIPTFTNINTCTFGGEYNVLTLNFTGVYTFSAFGSQSVYLTLTDNNNTPIVFGFPPITATISTTGTYYLHVSASGPPACTNSFVCHTTQLMATLPGAPTVVTHPSNTGGCPGGTVNFVCDGQPTTGVTYQWQENTGTGFTNLTNSAMYNGVTTKTLTINGILATMNGYQYRCVLTNSVGSVNTNSALLTVNQVTTLPFSENFNASLTFPTNWQNDIQNPWVVMANHGTGGTNGMTRNLFASITQAKAQTPQIGTIAANSGLSFDYRIVNWSNYPNTPTPLSQLTTDSLNVYVSNNCGQTFTLLGSINASNHNPSTSFANVSYALAAYAGQSLIFRFHAVRTASVPSDYYVDVDNINIVNLLPNDAGVSAFVEPPAGKPCYSSNQNVVVQIKNFGTNTLTTIPVKVLISGAATQTLSSTYNGNLAPNATTNFTVGSFNMTAAGTYSFKAFTEIIGDPNLNNDTLLPVITRTVVATATIPYMQDFNSSLTFPANWQNSLSDPWSVMANHGTNNSNGMSRNLWSSIVKAETDLMPIGPITPSTMLSFDYRYVDWASYPSTPTPTSQLVNDTMGVWISTNCGNTFSLLAAITGSNHVSSLNFANKLYSLATYSGQTVILKFKATRDPAQPSDYFIDVDNINIYNATAVDGGVSGIQSPVNGTCFTSNQNVAVVVQNYGTGSLTNIPVSVTIGGPVPTTISTIYTGTLAPGATVVVNVGTVNMSVGGVYTFTSSTNISGDGNNLNNSFSSNFTVSPMVSISGPTLACPGSSIILTASGSGIASYTWSSGQNTSSIVITPTSNVTYSVSVTGTNNCIVNSNPINITLGQNPTISVTGDNKCTGITGTLSASTSSGNTIYWYASPTSTTALASGNTFTTNAATTTTYYAQASSTAPGSILTTNAAGNGQLGNMFDVVALKNLTITGVDMHFSSAGVSTVEVWYRPGSFVGFETSNAGWTQVLTTTVNAPGTLGMLTTVPATFAIPVPAGQTYGIYVTTNGGPSVYYTNGTMLGNTYVQNSDIQVKEGKGGSYFNVTFTPRIFNGVLKYTGSGCSSPMTPVVFTVSPSPTINISPATPSICSGGSVVLTATGSATYTWNTGANTNSISVSPSVSTVYSVSGGATGCIGSASVNVQVVPGPSLIATANSGTQSASSISVCPNTNITMSVSGAQSYTWSNGSNAASFTLSPNTSTIFNVVGTNSAGCTSSAQVQVVVLICSGLYEIKPEHSNLYPNPFKEYVILENQIPGAVLNIRDALGRIVVSVKPENNKELIYLNSLPAGIYIYSWETNEGKKIKEGKLIKE